MSSCIQQITITTSVLLDGSNGSTRYFIRNDQYCFIRKVRKGVDCENCDTRNKYPIMDFFEVSIDGELFYVPETDAVHDSITRPAKFKNPHDYWEDYNKQPADWKKVYQEITGFDIRKTEKAIYNGEAIAQRLRGNPNEEIPE